MSSATDRDFTDGRARTARNSLRVDSRNTESRSASSSELGQYFNRYQQPDLLGGGSARPDHRHGAAGPCGGRVSPHYRLDDWEQCEQLRLRELEEARSRAAQMEKNMRWWSKCTADWREKWTRIRVERNQCRDDIRAMQFRIEKLQAEVEGLQQEKRETSEANMQLQRDLEKVRRQKLLAEFCDFPVREHPDGRAIRDMSIQCYISEQALYSILKQDVATNTEPTQQRADVEHYRTRVQELSERLQQEQGDKERIRKAAESELSILREKCQELELSKQAVIEELEESKLHLQDVSASATDNTMSYREHMDFTDDSTAGDSAATNNNEAVVRLQQQCARLQEENAREWSNRERLESDKIALEREVKNLRATVREMQDQLHARQHKVNATLSHDLKKRQAELNEKSKEIMEWTLAYKKQEGKLADKQIELDHSMRQVEQADHEVHRLRARVEELKASLSEADDEIDKVNTNARRLLRNNEELQTKTNDLQLHIEQLHTKMAQYEKRAQFKRRHSHPLPSAVSASVEAEL